MILEILKKEAEKNIVISISHKITTVKNSDQIFLIDNGEIVDYGKNEEMVRSNDLYKKLFA